MKPINAGRTIQCTATGSKYVSRDSSFAGHAGQTLFPGGGSGPQKKKTSLARETYQILMHSYTLGYARALSTYLPGGSCLLDFHDYRSWSQSGWKPATTTHELGDPPILEL